MTELRFVIANERHTALTALRPELPPPMDRLIDTAVTRSPGYHLRSGAVLAAALRAAATAV